MVKADVDFGTGFWKCNKSDWVSDSAWWHTYSVRRFGTYRFILSKIEEVLQRCINHLLNISLLWLLQIRHIIFDLKIIGRWHTQPKVVSVRSVDVSLEANLFVVVAGVSLVHLAGHAFVVSWVETAVLHQLDLPILQRGTSLWSVVHHSKQLLGIDVSQLNGIVHRIKVMSNIAPQVSFTCWLVRVVMFKISVSQSIVIPVVENPLLHF